MNKRKSIIFLVRYKYILSKDELLIEFLGKGREVCLRLHICIRVRGIPINYSTSNGDYNVMNITWFWLRNLWPILILFRLKKPTAAVIVTYHVKAIYPLCVSNNRFSFSLLQATKKNSFKCMAENFMQRHSFFYVILTQKQYRLDTS